MPINDDHDNSNHVDTHSGKLSSGSRRWSHSAPDPPPCLMAKTIPLFNSKIYKFLVD